MWFTMPHFRHSQTSVPIEPRRRRDVGLRAPRKQGLNILGRCVSPRDASFLDDEARNDNELSKKRSARPQSRVRVNMFALTGTTRMAWQQMISIRRCLRQV